MNNRKFGNYTVLAVVSIIALLAFSMLGVSLLAKQKSASAVSTPTVYIEKVFLPDAYADDGEYSPTEIRHIVSSAESIENGQFVMLNTEQATLQDEEGIEQVGREAIYIYFGGPNNASGLYFTNVNVRFNGQLIQDNYINEDGDTLETILYLHGLTPDEVAEDNLNSDYITRYDTGVDTEVSDPEGRYDIEIPYMDRETGQQYNFTFTFYLTTQKTYSVPLEMPSLNDTEKFTLSNQEYGMLHYFNYNNEYTTIYDENLSLITRSTKGELYYPQLYYNPEKYQITYTRTLYNYVETVELNFTARDSGSGEYGELIVTTSTNTGLSNSRTYRIEKGNNDHYTLRVQFDEAGEYVINKTARLRTGNPSDNNGVATYALASGEVVTSNEDLLKSERLVINGYTANYADSRSTTASLYDNTYAYNSMSTVPSTTPSVVYAHDFLTSNTEITTISASDPTPPESIYTADFSFLNTNASENNSVITNDSLTSTDVSATGVIENLFLDKSEGGVFNLNSTKVIHASTNMPPVSFEFYGRLQATNVSWYAYRDTLGNITVSNYTRNLQFQNAGTYLVYLTYENIIYESGHANDGMTYQYAHQIFYFEITNDTPQIEISAKTTSDYPGIKDASATALNMNDYTNDFVYVSWKNVGPFDAEITARYYAYDWSNNLIGQGDINALVYQQNSVGDYFDVTNGTPTMLYGTNLSVNGRSGLDGNYYIQVFREDSPEAFVNHHFVIDTAPITNITAVEIEGRHVAADENGDAIVISRLTDNASDYVLATNTPFAWTWDDKASGAEITARYVYSSIQTDGSFSLDSSYIEQMKSMAASNQNVLMPTDSSFGGFTPAINYNKVDITDVFTNLPTSQIISSPQFAVLLLTDAAGNTAIFITILDDTETQILQDPEQTSYVNIITDDTDFYWGTHKSISINQLSSTDNQINDILDFVNGDYTWTLSNNTFTADEIVKNALNSAISANNYITPIDSVEFSISDGTTETITPYIDTDGTPKNWWGTISVDPKPDSTDTHQTQIRPEGVVDNLNHPIHEFANSNSLSYTIRVYDEMRNYNGNFTVDVNLDRSQGTLRSYDSFEPNADGPVLVESIRTEDEVTDSQVVPNTYSTNRRYVTFSWTVADEYFTIDSIVLRFYPFSYNKDNENYPYSDSYEDTVIYDSDGESDYQIFTVEASGSVTSTHYQTSVLVPLDYVQSYGGAASSAGMYEIIRTYHDGFDENSAEAGGDTLVRTYTYYLDRNPIIPTDTSNYGSDISIGFGYDKGEYEGYPDYGGVTFNQFSRTSNSDIFRDVLTFDATNDPASEPTNMVIDSNILPASINLSTWAADNGNSVYDKYYYPVGDEIDESQAATLLNEIFDAYQNSSRVQVVVQTFIRSNTGIYTFYNQRFYSNIYRNNASEAYDCYPLDNLKHAFTNVGKYRVILFDLANTTGVMNGDATYFEELTYGNDLIDLSPNYTIFNFELTGISPDFNFQSGDTTFTDIDISQSNVTGADKVRISWSDPTDVYTAQLAFNDVLVYKTIYTKSNPKIDADGNENSGTTTSYSFSNPILLTCDADEYEELLSDPDEIENVTFIYRETQAELDAIINAALESTNLSDSEFYKMRVDGVYNYYILLPRADYENTSLYQNKLVDVEYTVNVHYIAMSPDDYDAPNMSNQSIYYETTQSLYVDNTSPYQNLVNLIENDVYLNSLNTSGTNFTDYLIENIDNDNVTFLKSYAFAVSSFTLDYLNEYESSLEYYYFRHENYTGNYLQQTVVQGQPGYDENAENIFSPTNPDYHLAVYRGGINEATGTTITEPGYYDIIEQDTAGNMRVYTIFVTGGDSTMHATINDDSIDFYTTTASGTTVYYNNQQYYPNNKDIIEFNSGDFRFDLIESSDLWTTFTIRNLMGQQERETYYYAPDDTLTNLPTFSGVTVNNIDTIIQNINNFIQETALTYSNSQGCRIQLTIHSRLNSDNDIVIYINTAGALLIDSEESFLSLITVNNDNTFTIRLPDTRSIPSTWLEDFRVYRDGSLQSYDANLKPLPNSASDITDDSIINGYTFRLASNVTYRFEFTDNFGRSYTYSYPTDTSVVRELTYSGGTMEYEYGGTLYTYTSNDVLFRYQSSALRINLSITDLDTNTLLYTNSNQDGTVSDLPTDSPYFDLAIDDMSLGVTNLTFNATQNIHYLVHIAVDNYTDTATIFEFVIYTHFPTISITDTAGSPLINDVTSRPVMISWSQTNSLFNPYVTLVSPDGTETEITSPTTVSEEGVYTVRLYNSMGVYSNGTRVFTIRSYEVSVYGVYQLDSQGNTTQLTAHSVPYNYAMTTGGTTSNMSMPQYFFLSSDSDWDRNIEIVRNRDKGLNYRVVDEFGNTRICNVYGTTTHVISTYFAVTRIPTSNISSATNFRINGETPTSNSRNIYKRLTDTENATATLTWETTYYDSSITTAGIENTYADFYSLELWYNNVLVGTYTSGNILLTQSGIYTIRIHDAVGQNQYFGANYTEFTLNLLNEVVYYVNDLAPIQYATFSNDVDLYIPTTFSGDLSEYDSLEVSITRNNEAYTLAATDGHYIFTEPGVYTVSMRGSIRSVVGTNSADLVSTYQFTILSPNEALTSYEFTAMTGYEIISVVRSGTDITDEVRGTNSTIHSIYIDPDNYGVGRYSITVRYAGTGYNPSQNYTFDFWINNEIPTISCSRDWGSSSTSGFTITINPASIYERVGDCYIVVNGQIVYTINAENGTVVEPQNFNYNEAGTYIVQIQSASGNVLSSNRLTIDVPLNTAAIILIVVACVVVVGLVIMFIIMRTRMKVR